MVQKKKSTSRNTHQLVIGDSRRLSMLKDNSAHLIVTSPPTWKPRKGARKNDIAACGAYDDYCVALTLVWEECKRILQPGCFACVHVADGVRKTYNLKAARGNTARATISSACRAAGLEPHGVIIWQREQNPRNNKKLNAARLLPRAGELADGTDCILILRKRGKAPLPGGANREKSRVAEKEHRKLFSGHWTFPDVKKSSAWLPVPDELVQRLIKMYSYVGETVLDPFAGSCTTMVAARDLSRSSIGVELDEECCDVARERVAGGHDSKYFSIEFQDESDGKQLKKRIARLKKGVASEKVDSRSDNASDRKSKKTEKSRKTENKSNNKDTTLEVEIAEMYNIDHLRTADGRDVKLLGVEVPGEFFSRNPGVFRQAFNFVRSLTDGKKLTLKKPSGGSGVYLFGNRNVSLNERIIRSGFALSDHKSKHELRKSFDKSEDLAKSQNMGTWALKKTDTPRPRD